MSKRKLLVCNAQGYQQILCGDPDKHTWRRRRNINDQDDKPKFSNPLIKYNNRSMMETYVCGSVTVGGGETFSAEGPGNRNVVPIRSQVQQDGGFIRWYVGRGGHVCPEDIHVQVLLRKGVEESKLCRNTVNNRSRRLVHHLQQLVEGGIRADIHHGVACDLPASLPKKFTFDEEPLFISMDVACTNFVSKDNCACMDNCRDGEIIRRGISAGSGDLSPTAP